VTPGRDEFASCQARLSEAKTLFAELHEQWTELCVSDPWRVHAIRESEVLWRSDVECVWEPELAARMDVTAAALARSVKAAMDDAVHATASVLCGDIGTIPRDSHQMPLTTTRSEFDALREANVLMGLRPDHFRLLEEFQPWTSGSPKAAEVGLHLTHLANVLRQPEGHRLAIWGETTAPSATAGGVKIDEIHAARPGRVQPTYTAAHFRVPLGQVGEDISVVPNVEFDLIFNAEPDPRFSLDTLPRRARRWIDIATMLVDMIAASVSGPMVNDAFRLSDALPVETEDPWLPVEFNDPTERARAIAGLSESPYGLGSLRDDKGSLTLLRLEPVPSGTDGASTSRVVGRVISAASVIDPDLEVGYATESAALQAAGDWGLADFVYPPTTRQTGSGVRELGDGTIVSGTKGLALQVKAREAASADAEAETRWLLKRARKAAKQASGTVRMFLNRPTVTLQNMRGRDVTFDGAGTAWVGVVILDHPSPPSGVSPAAQTTLPTVFILRRDWEFVWDQLRSASAVIDYFHRVAQSPPSAPPLGEESLRYLELAHADLAADPGPSPWMDSAGLTSSSTPNLPLDPASAMDEIGHALFRHVLDDIAESVFDSPERDRLDALARLDRYAVTDRAALGRALIEWLDACMLAPPSSTLWHHRSMFLDDGHLQLAFSVCSTYTGYHLELHRNWLMLRRRQLIEHLASVGRADFNAADVWTIGVLLTPRVDGPPMWDTTVAATNIDPEFDQDSLELFTRVFGPLGTEGNLADL
jgi:hypothetical protein